ncbi:type VI secretion system-associated FHA domain protein TagH [Pokkaliibacter sp. CJK22405]|uniref:type VI secretion system-associated FHA domain protein TagH n=1 Tax=Pokkaliibacter sp. CJK22405 TaxID=3384615 RepID=UPI003984C7C3
MDMELELSIKSYHRLTPDQESVKVFGPQGGTIGRSEKADWYLPDPARVLSGIHASIEKDGDGFVVTDMSTNGLFINRSVDALGKGNRHVLQDKDMLQLNDYDIEVALRQKARVAEPLVAAPIAAPEPKPEASVAPVAAQMAEPESAAFSTSSAGIRGMSQLGLQDHFPTPQGHAPAAGNGTQIPEDWDWLAEPEPAPVSNRFDEFLRDEPVAAQPVAPAPKAEPAVVKAPAPAPVAEVAAPEPVIAPEPVVKPQPAMPEAPVFAQPEPVAEKQPLPVVEVPVDAPPVEPQPAAKAPEPEVKVAPAPQSVKAPAPKTAPETPSTVDAATELAALKAFVRGLGIHPDMAPADHDPQWWETVGGATRQLLEGLLIALRERSRFKSEFRVNQTQFRAAENNPLKFSASVEDAVHNLFNRRSSSFMSAEKAIADAYADIAGHEKALLQGVDGAVNGLLRQLDPESISQRQFKEGMFDKFNPARKQANYWQLYTELHESLMEDSRGRQQSYLDDFIQAYETAERAPQGH